MNPIQRFKTQNPYAFYSIATALFAGIAGTAAVLLKK